MFGQLVNFVKMAGYFCVNFEEFWSIFGHLPTFCPLSKTKVATQKPRIYAGLRGFWSKAHFYFYLIVKKKLINIYKYAKKSGLLTRNHKNHIFLQNFRHRQKSVSFFTIFKIREKNMPCYRGENIF